MSGSVTAILWGCVLGASACWAGAALADQDHPNNAPAAQGGAPDAGTGGEAAEASDYGARGRARRELPGARRFEGGELREVPGSVGDPWRVLEALPGTVPVLSGLPYVYLRGAPPSGTLYSYDDIPVPTLYHLAIGPAVIHPRMIGPLTLYSGVAPARYGRASGGVVVAEGPGASSDASQDEGEFELRLLDVSAYARAAALGGSVAGAVRYGYPALVLSIASPDVSLAYWDYQLRYAAALSNAERFELVALGSHDALQIRSAPDDSLALSYHRIEARYTREAGRTRIGAALLAGWEQAALGRQLAMRASRLGPRVWFERGWGRGHRLRASLDMQAIFGEVTRQSVDPLAEQSASGRDGGMAGGMAGGDWILGGAGLSPRARARSAWGAQLELTWRLGRSLELLAGARGDVWLQAGGLLAAADPRLRLVAHLSESLRLHVAAGTTHQPSVPFLPLPGLSDLPLSDTLQHALQGEAGVSWDAALPLRIELQGFLHRYRDLTFTDTAALSDACDGRVHDAVGGNVICRSDAMPSPDRVDGYAYGGELFVRSIPSADRRLSGFVSYTLALATLAKVAGLPYTPDWDVRHVANVVVKWRISDGWSVGFRAFVRSGKSHGEYFLGAQQQLGRFEARMPGFARLDVELGYGWRTSWGRLRLAIEWLNVTLAREPADLECGGSPRMCGTRYLPPIAVPNLSLRGDI